MQFLTHIDLNKNELQNAVIQNLAAAPSNPKVGQIYYNTADQMTYQWKKTSAEGVTPETFAWKAIGGVTAGDGLVNNDDTLSVDVGNGIELSGTSPNKKVAAKAYNGITVNSNGISVKPYDGITVNSNGVSADIDTTKGLEFTGTTAGSKKIGIKVDSTLEFNNGTLKVKVPTDNNFTTGLKEKLEDIEAGAEVNTIETVKVNGTALTPDANKAIDVPTIHTATFADDSTNTAASPVKLTLTEGTDNDTITANIPKVGADSAGVLPKVTGNTSSTKIVSADYVWDATQGDYRQLPTGAFKTGTVTSITINATAPVVSSSSSAITSSGTRTISLADGYGDTKNPYAAKAASTVLAGPASGADAVPTFRALTVDDISDISDDYLAKSGGTMSGAINMGSNKITSLGAPTADTDAATKKYVDDAITNLPEPMIFKGTLGTGGTITSLPTAAAGNEGWTYKVITAGTYDSQVAKVGDLFICRNVSGSLYEWTYVPSGDEPSGTVTNVETGSGLTGGPITTTGTISLATAYGDTVNPYGSKTANYVLAAPNGSNGVPSFRALVAGDIPSLSEYYVTKNGDDSIGGDKSFTNTIGFEDGISIINYFDQDQEDYTSNIVIKNTYGSHGGGTGALELTHTSPDYDVDSNVRILGVAEPHNAYEAANKLYVDNNTVGSVAFSDDSTNNSTNPVKLTVYNSNTETPEVLATGNIPKVSSSSAGVVPKGAAVSTQSQTTKFLREDGTWAVPSYRDMAGDVDMNSHKISELASPTAGTDATNKTYVDTAISTAIAEVTGGAVKRRKAENPALTASGGAFTWSISTGSAATNSPGPDTMVTVYEKGATTNVQVMPEIAINSTGAITITINDTEGLGTLAAGTYIAVMIGC